MELTITGINAATSPHLHVWDWRVALYLFLGGLSAGLAVMASVLNVRQGGALTVNERAASSAQMLVPVILSVGMIFIFLDLARKLNVFWLYLSFQPLSPMSWGSWGLLVFYPVSILFAIAAIPAEGRKRLLFRQLIELAEWLQQYRFHLAAANFAMGIFIGIYTGILLSSFVARPLWNSAILPILFLCSALSAGAALMIMIAGQKKVKLFFTKIDIWLIITEMTLLPLFFYGQYTSSYAHRKSIMPFFMFNHQYFWYGLAILLLLIILPAALVIKLLEIKEEHGDTLTPDALFKMNLSAIIVLMGGLIIRFSFVYAGQLSHL
jgi:formate-dependent nitrite reductase membrane component NrfD